MVVTRADRDLACCLVRTASATALLVRPPAATSHHLQALANFLPRYLKDLTGPAYNMPATACRLAAAYIGNIQKAAINKG